MFPRGTNKVPRRFGAVAVLTALMAGTLVPAASHVSAAGPTTSNTLSIGWGIETKTLDPGAAAQNPDIWVMVNIYDTLVRIAPNGKTLQPDLATSWNISKDGMTYTFHLRPGVKFQNGAPLTSQDVAFDIMRTATKNPGWAFLYTAIKSASTPNSSTVVFHLKHPWSPFLYDMTLFAGGIYPEAYFKKVGAAYMSKHPIGTGPYSFVTWVKGQYILLQKNQSYWNASKYPMQYVKYELIPSDNTRLLDVESGQLDVDNPLPPDQVAALKGNSSAVALVNPSTQTNYFTFNTKVKPFNEVNVRQAISHAIDRAAMAKAVYAGLAKPANSFMPAGALYYDPNIPVPAYSLSLAKQYLAKSSVPHGFNMTMETGSGDSIGNAEAQILQQELAPLGIKMTIRQVDQTTLFNNQQVGKYNFTTNLWTNDIPDPDELVSFSMDYTTGNYSFFTWYNNPLATKLSREGEQANDPAQRQKIYYQIQQIWAKDQPFMALYYVPFINAVSTKVHGFSENPLGYFNLEGVTKS